MTIATLPRPPSWIAFFAWLFPAKPKKYSIAEPFQPITARDLIDAANIEPEARSLAVQRLPAAHQTAPSNAEARAIEIVETRIRARSEILAGQIHDIHERLAEVPDPRDDRNIAHLPQHVTNLIMDVFANFSGIIRATIAKERSTKAEFEAWRDEHKLCHREAVYPVSKIFTFAAAIVLLLLETTVNSALYFNASDTGWLGAYATALLIAGVNVGLAVLSGYAPCRYLNHINPRHRWWAIPALAIAVPLIVINNLFAAHYRDLASATTDAPFNEFQVATRMSADPIGLSPTSFALLIFGFLCALIAGRKGYTASDPYPGYEAQHRRYIEALENVAYVEAEVHGGLETVRKAEIVYAADRPLAARALIEGIGKSYAALAANQIRNGEFDTGDIKALTTAVQRFRDLNLHIRTDGIVPAYFRNEPAFSHLSPPCQPETGLSQLIGAASERHRQHTVEFQKMINRLLRQVETAKDKTGTIMRAIEASCVDETTLPKLSEIRAVLDPELKDT